MNPLFFFQNGMCLRFCRMLLPSPKGCVIPCQQANQKAEQSCNDCCFSHCITSLVAAGYTFGPFQYNDFLSNDKLFQIQSDVIRKVAGEHSCVIVGRCADYILRDNKRCINVFVHADIEERVKTVMNRQHISEQEARELIRKMDKTRPNYYNFYSDKEWGVASSYHLSVD